MDFKTYFKFKNNLPYKLLEEAIQLNDFITEKQNKKAAIFNGRFQPFTIGHKSFIKQMKKDYPSYEPVIVIIKGAKTSLELDKNPFNVDDQINFILKATKDLGITKDNIIIAPNSYILTLVQAIREKGYEPSVIYAGPDRLKCYESMLNSTAETTDGNEVVLKEAFNLDIEYKSGESDGESRVEAADGKPVSASLVRQTLLDGDYESFSKYTEGYDEKDFEYMKGKIEYGLKYAKNKKLEAEIEKLEKKRDKKLESLMSQIEKAKTDDAKSKKQNEYDVFKDEFEAELKKLNQELEK